MNFADRYGPWAVIAGASEGTGRSFAQQLAGRGLNCLLIARREGPLQALATQLRAEHGIECVTASIDLAKPDAHERIAEAVADREVGLFISNAGADPHGSQFLDKEIDAWIDLVNRNIVTSLRCCHHFGTKMRERGRGGLLLVGSGACYGGGAYLATYTGAKAFDLCFAESLWAELQPFGVDVLYLVMTATDTPAFRELLARNDMPVRTGLASSDAVAQCGLDRLAHGPVHNFGHADEEAGFAPTSPAQRRERVMRITAASRSMFGSKET